ncbi:hypothetical protein [Capnocytophaga canis]|uniref:hypothetical protein n=1 Tax=Capnocytophaga canis TaxID=1848903 RepID=UPI0037D97396
MEKKYNIGDVFHTLNENNEVILNIVYSIDVKYNKDNKVTQVVYKAVPLKQKIILNQTSYSYKLRELINSIK